ncbi:MAG: peptidoglycan DD-metalloendopeptidase family protein [Eubacterium sp.]|nr:peptidoglycan DD-metalloendopeptidase family protein [Eubacterium sp.]
MRSNKTSKLLSFFLCICLVFTTLGALGSTAYATDNTAKLNEKKEKIQAQIDEAQEKVDKLEKKKKKTQAYVEQLDRKVKLKQDKINVLEAEAKALQEDIDKVQGSIEKTEEEIDRTQKEIDRLQAEFDKTYEEYCQRLRAMYVSGSVNNIEVIITSSDISSILTRSEMIKSVAKKDNNTLDMLMKQMSLIEKKKAELEKARVKLNKQKKKLDTDKAALDNNIATVTEEKASLKSEIGTLNQAIAELSKTSDDYLEAIDEDQARLAKVEAEIQAAIARASQSSSGSSVGTGEIAGSVGSGEHSGELGYPTDGRSISAGFPNYSSGRYHGGIDFPVPTGSNVYAAANGTVILVKALYYSYGHYIIIDHGNGLSTLYAHNSELLVSVGQHVKKGQVIAHSGSTGNSTGPHSHFEVRINGTRVNPMNYL